MSRIVAATVLCGLVVAATACGERSEPTGASANAYPVTVTGADGTTTRVESRPRRILAVGSEMLATLQALGVRAQVLQDSAALPSRRFDLTLTWASSEDGDAFLRRRPRGEVYVAPDRSLEDVQRSLGRIGLLVGKPLPGRRLGDRIGRQRRLVASRLAGAPAASVFLDTGFFHTVSSRSLAGDIIREAGGTNVAGATPEPGPFDLEVLEARDPRFYVATSESGTTLPGLRRNDQTRALTAVKRGRFGVIATSLLDPGPNVGLAVAALARVLHPDAFR